MRKLFAIFCFAVLLLASSYLTHGQVTARPFRNDVFTILYPAKNSDSIRLAVEDIQKYIRQVIPGSIVSLKTTTGTGKGLGNLIVLLDERDAAMKDVSKKYNITPLPHQWNSFKISGAQRTDDKAYSVHFLQGREVPANNMPATILLNVSSA